MSRPVALVTGAGGELGHVLVPELDRRGYDVVALDLQALPPALAAVCRETIQMNVLDLAALRILFRRVSPSAVFHLAALLSAHAERDPDLAHQVNVDGTLGLLKLCWRFDTGPIRFFFPSSIAVYGLPDAQVKADQGALAEWQWTTPRGMYGCNKLYCELIGAYLSGRPPDGGRGGLDFRAIRFPGLISADTLPTGGTTDYAPEMVHAAAAGRPYSCFVREDSRLPFMTMPDAVEALLALTAAPAERLTTRVYNIRGFSASAGEIRAEVLRHFPDAQIRFAPLPEKQAIVDSWPADVDDTRARRDWGLAPRQGLREALGDYLAPALRGRARTASR
jgi:nucleoside-diphosphate-sugar epimerase